MASTVVPPFFEYEHLGWQSELIDHILRNHQDTDTSGGFGIRDCNVRSDAWHSHDLSRKIFLKRHQGKSLKKRQEKSSPRFSIAAPTSSLDPLGLKYLERNN